MTIGMNDGARRAYEAITIIQSFAIVEDWVGLNSAMLDLEVYNGDIYILLSWLRGTYAYRSKLPYWQQFRNLVAVKVERAGADSTLLKGL